MAWQQGAEHTSVSNQHNLVLAKAERHTNTPLEELAVSVFLQPWLVYGGGPKDHRYVPHMLWTRTFCI